ncbi:MAG: hypothetical protein CVV34_01280 [Methanomicrobiales archaeon HGW-Methanomicrobiales-5]|nr:MAG: hypothetical protein CVV34_01280 [Methanomicrobiales archaeon HGW-Methanomicrobiales-5]
MDYGSMVGESFEYAKEAVVGKWNKWVMLIIATILLGLPLMGYSLKILRGEKPAPEVEDWGTLFIDGIKYLIISLIYAIPAFIVLFFVVGVSILGSMSGDPATAMAAIGSMMIGLLVFFVVILIIGIFELIGIVRFARTGSMGEAFNFSAILATIGKIGWVPYIIALVVLGVVGVIFAIIVTILMMIPILGFIIYLCLIAPWTLFVTRYICQLYDNAGSA